MQKCVTCNGEGWMMQSEGEPCDVCSLDGQIGGSGWLNDDGTPMPVEEMFALGKIPDPAATLSLTLVKDGNQWCVLYGPDLAVGIAGFGDTPNDAVADFNKNWAKQFAPPRMMTDAEREELHAKLRGNESATDAGDKQ
jgi:hypothetical protein